MNETDLNKLTYLDLVRQAYAENFTDSEIDDIFKEADDLFNAKKIDEGENKEKEAMKELIRQMLERRLPKSGGGSRYRKRKSKRRKSKRRKSKKKKKSKTHRRRR